MTKLRNDFIWSFAFAHMACYGALIYAYAAVSEQKNSAAKKPVAD